MLNKMREIMGTRAIVRVETSDGKQLVNLYRQCDGYPSGLGLELFKFLDGKRIINGIQNETDKTAFNGAGCLAAGMVAAIKDGIGSAYLYPVDQIDCNQEYEYKITVTNATYDGVRKDGSIAVSVISYEKVIFTGSVAEFGAFCNSDGEE